MANILFEPSGIHLHGDKLKIRLDIYPQPGEKAYQTHYINVPVIPDGGYPGPVNEIGYPKSQSHYDNWYASLPRIWTPSSHLGLFVQIGEDISLPLLREWIDDVLTPDVIATIDDHIVLPDSIHRISKYMRTRTKLSTAKVTRLDNNDRLAIEAMLGSLNAIVRGGDVNPMPPGSLDVGSPATDRSGTLSATYTFIVRDNPVNGDGTIDTVQLYANANALQSDAGIFTDAGSNAYYSTDYEDIGNVQSGAVRTYSGLDMTCVEGQLIGWYYASGNGESDSTGYGGLAYYQTNMCADTTQRTCTIGSTYTISCYGTGTESATPYVGTPATLAVSITGYAPTIELGPLTVTPATLSLSITGYEPEAGLGPITCTPATLSISISGYIPDIEFAYACTPATLELSISGESPTVALGPLTCTPPTLSIAITGYIPDVGLAYSCVPATLELSISTYAPVIENDVECEPGKLDLALTGYIPTVDNPVTSTPSTLGLSITGYIPTIDVTAHVTAIPTTLGITLDGYAPAIQAGGNIEAVPDLLSISLTGYIPTVSVTDNIEVVPATQELTLSGLAPNLRETVTPPTLSLAITGHSPTLSETVTPTTLSFTLSTHIPTVSTPTDCVAGTLSIAITGYIPTVTVTEGSTLTPATLSLSLTGHIPAVDNPVTVTPSLMSVSIASYAPTVAVTTNANVTPATLELAVSGHSPSVTTAAGQLVPATLSVSISGYIPSISAPAVITNPTLALTLTGNIPIIWAPQTLMDDNFNDNSRDLFWDELVSGGGSVAETSQHLLCSPSNDSVGYVTHTFYGLGECDISVDVDRTGGASMVLMLCPTKTTDSSPYNEDDWYRVLKHNDTQFYVQRKLDGGTPSLRAMGSTDTVGTLRITISNGTITFYVDDVEVYNESYLLPSNNCYVYLYGSSSSTVTGIFDNFLGYSVGYFVGRPEPLSLSLSSYAPVVVGYSTELTPAPLTLSLSEYAPTATVTNNVECVPTTLTLTLDGYAPDALLGIHLIPGVLALALTGLLPSAGLGPMVCTPAPLNLALTGYTVAQQLTVSPTPLAIALSSFIPTAAIRESIFEWPLTISMLSRSLTLALLARTLEIPLHDKSLTLEVRRKDIPWNS